eukprot:GHVH01005028.1.p1 GENE.GHVH01005028.1~~GHVH01005028.1.p1  ORF type:complete len:1525 (+),score=256.25 GHVH01005028.1:984-5558(+)
MSVRSQCVDYGGFSDISTKVKLGLYLRSNSSISLRRFGNPIFKRTSMMWSIFTILMYLSPHQDNRAVNEGQIVDHLARSIQGEGLSNHRVDDDDSRMREEPQKLDAASTYHHHHHIPQEDAMDYVKLMNGDHVQFQNCEGRPAKQVVMPAYTREDLLKRMAHISQLPVERGLLFSSPLNSSMKSDYESPPLSFSDAHRCIHGGIPPNSVDLPQLDYHVPLHEKRNSSANGKAVTVSNQFTDPDGLDQFQSTTTSRLNDTASLYTGDSNNSFGRSLGMSEALARTLDTEECDHPELPQAAQTPDWEWPFKLPDSVSCLFSNCDGVAEQSPDGLDVDRRPAHVLPIPRTPSNGPDFLPDRSEDDTIDAFTTGISPKSCVGAPQSIVLERFPPPLHATALTTTPEPQCHLAKELLNMPHGMLMQQERVMPIMFPNSSPQANSPFCGFPPQIIETGEGSSSFSSIELILEKDPFAEAVAVRPNTEASAERGTPVVPVVPESYSGCRPHRFRFFSHSNHRESPPNSLDAEHREFLDEISKMSKGLFDQFQGSFGFNAFCQCIAMDWFMVDSIFRLKRSIVASEVHHRKSLQREMKGNHRTELVASLSQAEMKRDCTPLQKEKVERQSSPPPRGEKNVESGSSSSFTARWSLPTVEDGDPGESDLKDRFSYFNSLNHLSTTFPIFTTDEVETVQIPPNGAWKYQDGTTFAGLKLCTESLDPFESPFVPVSTPHQGHSTHDPRLSVSPLRRRATANEPDGGVAVDHEVFRMARQEMSRPEDRILFHSSPQSGSAMPISDVRVVYHNWNKSLNGVSDSGRADRCDELCPACIISHDCGLITSDSNKEQNLCACSSCHSPRVPNPSDGGGLDDQTSPRLSASMSFNPLRNSTRENERGTDARSICTDRSTTPFHLKTPQRIVHEEVGAYNEIRTDELDLKTIGQCSRPPSPTKSDEVVHYALPPSYCSSFSSASMYLRHDPDGRLPGKRFTKDDHSKVFATVDVEIMSLSPSTVTRQQPAGLRSCHCDRCTAADDVVGREQLTPQSTSRIRDGVEAANGPSASTDFSPWVEEEVDVLLNNNINKNDAEQRAIAETPSLAEVEVTFSHRGPCLEDEISYPVRISLIDDPAPSKVNHCPMCREIDDSTLTLMQEEISRQYRTNGAVGLKRTLRGDLNPYLASSTHFIGTYLNFIHAAIQSPHCFTFGRTVNLLVQNPCTEILELNHQSIRQREGRVVVVTDPRCKKIVYDPFQPLLSLLNSLGLIQDSEFNQIGSLTAPSSWPWLVVVLGPSSPPSDGDCSCLAIQNSVVATVTFIALKMWAPDKIHILRSNELFKCMATHLLRGAAATISEPASFKKNVMRLIRLWLSLPCAALIPHMQVQGGSNVSTPMRIVLPPKPTWEKYPLSRQMLIESVLLNCTKTKIATDSVISSAIEDDDHLYLKRVYGFSSLQPACPLRVQTDYDRDTSSVPQRSTSPSNCSTRATGSSNKGRNNKRMRMRSVLGHFRARDPTLPQKGDVDRTICSMPPLFELIDE